MDKPLRVGYCSFFGVFIRIVSGRVVYMHRRRRLDSSARFVGLERPLEKTHPTIFCFLSHKNRAQERAQTSEKRPQWLRSDTDERT